MRPEVQTQLDRLSESMRLMHAELSERMFLAEALRPVKERGSFSSCAGDFLLFTGLFALVKMSLGLL